MSGTGNQFDIDAQFNAVEPGAEKSWEFALRSPDVAPLQRIAADFENEFLVELLEEVPTIEDGREVMGPPMLVIAAIGVFSRDDLKVMAARITQAAAKEGVTYEGLECYDPMESDEMFSWLDLDAAVWRLRLFTDTGLEPGGHIPWVFAIAGAAPKLKSLLRALDKKLYEDAQVVTEEDGSMLLLKVSGVNDESALTARYQAIERVASAAQLEMLGVQFFDDDADDSEDEDD